MAYKGDKIGTLKWTFYFGPDTSIDDVEYENQIGLFFRALDSVDFESELYSRMKDVKLDPKDFVVDIEEDF